MTQQTQAHAVIVRERTRIEQPRNHPIHPGYVAIVAKAHALGLPQCYPTDITIHDRRLIIQRQPCQFAWRADTVAAACSETSAHWIICTPPDGSMAMRYGSGGTAATLADSGYRSIDRAYADSVRRTAMQSSGSPARAAVRSSLHHSIGWMLFPARRRCAAPSPWRSPETIRSHSWAVVAHWPMRSPLGVSPATTA
jgi:hypothetical protein